MKGDKDMVFNFDVMLCGGWAGGHLEIEAEDYDVAYEKAMDHVSQKLVEAFPELEIEYNVVESDD